MILVVSGGGFRAFYALGVLKALEELGISDKISVCFGVSGGAIILAWWLSGYKANEIFDTLINLNYFKFLKPNLKLYKSLVDINSIEKLFSYYLKTNFESLNKKLFIGAVDLLEAKYILYYKGNLIKPLLGSMSIPGIFPGIEYKGKFLVDGGVINNFPTDIAKEMYPNKKIIGIALNNVGKIDKINNIFYNLVRSWQIAIQSSTIDNIKYVDVLFYPKLNVRILDIRKNKLKEIFRLGYKDALYKFSKRSVF